MIKVVVGNNLKDSEIIIDENTCTLKSACEQAGIDYTRGMMHLDGATLMAGDLDKTFADFGIKTSCFLLNVVKADNALR